MILLGLIYVQVIIILVNADHLECPPEMTRLITTSDIDTSGLQIQGFDNFDDLISTSPDLSDGYYTSYDAPNTGHFIFKETFLIHGFITNGNDLSGMKYFVKTFTIRYANATDSEYRNYTNVFSTNSIDKVYFSFEEPLLVRKMEFTVLTFNTEYTSYYWNLNLLGCRESDANDTSCPILPSSSPAVSSSSVLLSVAPSQTESSSSSPTSSPLVTTIISTIRTTTTRLLTTTVTASSSCTDINGSIQRLVTEQSANSCAGPITAAVLLPILLTILFAVLITVILFWMYSKKRNVLTSRPGRSGTIKEFSNIALYTKEDMNKSKGIYDEVKKEEDMIENESYLSSSGQTLIQDLSAQYLPPVPEENEYSAIDHYYPSNVSNASSNKYEYVSPAANIVPPSSADIEEVNSELNPSYSAI